MPVGANPPGAQALGRRRSPEGWFETLHDRPYPGSAIASIVNGGISGPARSLAWELAPIRVNVIHPGITGESPYWEGKPPAILEGHRSKTITGKLATMAEIVDATRFLLENESMDGVDLAVDNGRLMF